MTVVEYLERPGLARLLAAARERYEANGGPRGRVVLDALAPEEASALNGLLAPPTPYPAGGRARVALARLDAELRGSRLAITLEQALCAIGGPPRDSPAARAEARRARREAWDEVVTHPVAARSELAPWLEHVRRSWGAGRPGHNRLALRALDVLADLPAEGEELAALAARHTGDAHALDRSQPVGRMVAAALLVLEDRPPGQAVSASGWRELWERVGVACDALSCTALTLGVRPARGARGMLARRLRAAARTGEPAVLTLRELRGGPIRLRGERLFVVENPSVVAAAAQALGHRVPPLLCSGGWPNTAVATMLDAASASGMEIRVHADFDWAGAAIVARLAERHGARPWRCSAVDYEAALGGGAGGVELPPSPAAAPESELAAALARHGRAVHEEAVLEALLEDLRRSRPSTPGQGRPIHDV